MCDVTGMTTCDKNLIFIYGWPLMYNFAFFLMIIELQKQLVHVVLIEPKGGDKDQDIYINNVLIEEGYAVSLPEVNDISCDSNNSSLIDESDNLGKTENKYMEKKSRILTTKDVLNKLASYKKNN